MNRTKLSRGLCSVVLLSLAGAAAGCVDGGGEDTSSSSSSGTPGPLTVALNFHAKAGTEDVACGTTITGVGTTASSIQVTDLRFYVHDVRLIASDNTEVPVTLTQNEWQLDDVALLDFETGSPGCSDGNAATHTAITGTVPAGNYTGVVFRLGVPFSKNHQDTATAPAPLNLTPLWWNWNGGYKFMKFDLTSTGMSGGWFVHVGSTGCTPMGNEPTTCAAENRPEIRLADFEYAHMAIQLDVKSLLADANVDANQAGAPGCMSGQTDPECAALFPKLGLPINGAGAGTQSVFSAVHNH